MQVSQPRLRAALAGPSYPVQFIERLPLRRGGSVTLRPVLPRDAEGLQEFVAGLSDGSRASRFDGCMQSLSAPVARRMAEIDYARQMAFVCTVGHGGQVTIVADGRYVVANDGVSAVFALVVGDAFQGQGLGTRLLDVLTRAALAAQLWRIYGEVLPGNQRMLSLMASCGFDRRLHRQGEERVRLERRLGGAAPGATGRAAAQWADALCRTH
jgi:acetyltransferase